MTDGDTPVLHPAGGVDAAGDEARAAGGEAPVEDAPVTDAVQDAPASDDGAPEAPVDGGEGVV